MKCKFYLNPTDFVTNPFLVGAALFYTSTLQPYTFHNLRQYILHRLLTTSTKSYPFKLKAQVVERDAVLVPSGWDSWGKLRVLRDGFDCDAVHQGWDSDMDAVTDRQQPSLHGARGNFEEIINNPNFNDQVTKQVLFVYDSELTITIAIKQYSSTRDM